jgi:hypothetical protein
MSPDGGHRRLKDDKHAVSNWLEIVATVSVRDNFDLKCNR